MKLLIVDDDPVNRIILHEYLEEEGYTLIDASGGEEAWTLLETEGEEYFAVLLDRMMPKVDGIAVLNRMMSHEKLKHIPVIMQTAAGAAYEVQEGIEAGAFFYLTKPFDRALLVAIVAAAVRKSAKQREVQNDLRRQSLSVLSLKTGVFQVRTIEEVHNLAILLAHACPDPEKVVMGLNDLLVNAVEHGNLGITFEEKTQLHEGDRWEGEIQRRLNMPEYAGKYVEVRFERHDEEIHFHIKDQGEGFDWKLYEELSPEMALSSHGRGIAMAKALCFDRLEYHGVGNEVLGVVKAPMFERTKTEEKTEELSDPLCADSHATCEQISTSPMT